MQRHGIVDRARDVGLLERSCDAVAPLAENRVLVINMLAARQLDGRCHAMFPEPPRVGAGNAPAFGVEPIDVSQLYSQEGGLNVIKPAVKSQHFVVVALAAAVVAQHAQARSHTLVLADDQSSIAQAAKILTREKAETSSVAESPCLTAAHARP